MAVFVRKCDCSATPFSCGFPGWTWARVAVWDVAGNGGFVNPVWRE